MKFKFARYIAIISITFIAIVLYFFFGVVRPGLNKFAGTNDIVDQLYLTHGNLVEYRLNLTQLFNQSVEDKDLLEKQIILLEKIKSARAEILVQVDAALNSEEAYVEGVGDTAYKEIVSVFNKVTQVITEQEVVLSEFDTFTAVFSRLYKYEARKLNSLEDNEVMLTELHLLSADIKATLEDIENTEFDDDINISKYIIQLGDLDKRVGILIEELSEDPSKLVDKKGDIKYISDKHTELKLLAFEDNLTIMKTLKFVESLKDLSNKMVELKDVIYEIERSKEKFILLN